MSVVIRAANKCHTICATRKISFHQKQKCVAKAVCTEWKLAIVISGIRAKGQTCCQNAVPVAVRETIPNPECTKTKDNTQRN